FTAFHGFAVNVASLDLRTLQFLNKNFPRLNGTVTGSTILDSVWTDVRFSNAQLTHRDGPGPESHVTGSGRVTWGELYLTYDLDLQAQPLAFETIRKSYVNLPLHASLGGPIRVQGQSPDLRLTTTLSGDAGTVAYDGRVDADPPVYGAHGSGTVTGADLQTLLANASFPHTSLSGTYTIDVTGDSLPDFVGSAVAQLQESRIGSATLEPSIARVHFGDGLVTIDTLIAHTAGARAEASGVIATAAGKATDVTYHVDLSSVRELDRLLGRTGESGITGPVSVSGTLTGPLSALQTTGTLVAHDLAAGSARFTRIAGDYSFDHLSAQPSGVVTLRADTIATPLLPLQHATLALRVANGNSATFRTEFSGSGSMRGDALGSVARDSTGVVTLRVDSARVAVDSLDAYALSSPTRLVADSRGFTLDSMILARSRGGVIALRNAGVVGDSIRGSLRTRDFSLAFLELFGSSVTNLRGALTANVDVAGTTTHPLLRGSVTVDNGSGRIAAAGLRLDRLDADIGLDGDTLVVRKLTAVTDRERRGTLDVGGTISFARFDHPVFSLRAAARNFRAVDQRGLATLDVTTTTPITLNGPYTGAVVSGALRVDRGTVYIPEVVRKRV
ncbi:MAG TPA: translocation/assembly module TamB domain-containing protein, partial [Candidatus Elarobacter sp.]|nr:translocation/assembly module TamB domain-containing protein [Candidatus Elarobacter sp.]